jgi:hypothetical protein
MQQFLGALQQTGHFNIQTSADVPQHLQGKLVGAEVLVLELDSEFRRRVQALRASGHPCVLVAVGQAWNKEDTAFALQHRVYCTLEKPAPSDPAVLVSIQSAVAQAEQSERSQSVLRVLKTALLAESASKAAHEINELKLGLSQIEKSLRSNELLGVKALPGGETKIPFSKSDTLADAMLTIEDLGRTGTLAVRSEALVGTVDFIQGRPTAASAGETRALKAIYRMFLWEQPLFEFRHHEAGDTLLKDHFEISLREICRNGESLKQRFERIRSNLPPGNVRLQLDPATLNAQTRLGRDEFSALSSVVELGNVSQVLDFNALPDVILYECLISLRRHGIIKVFAVA